MTFLSVTSKNQLHQGFKTSFLTLGTDGHPISQLFKLGCRQIRLEGVIGALCSA